MPPRGLAAAQQRFPSQPVLFTAPRFWTRSGALVVLSLLISIGALSPVLAQPRAQPVAESITQTACGYGFQVGGRAADSDSSAPALTDDRRIGLPEQTPAASPTATATATWSPTPRRSTYRIDGCVVHFSGCGGSAEFGVVHLSPLGRTANVTAGYFSFADVPPGDYTLTYTPACNPAGCTGIVHVKIVDRDGYAAFGRSDCAGDCSVDHQVTVDEILMCVNMALGNSAACPLCDADGSGRVTVDELLQAVGALFNGCR